MYIRKIIILSLLFMLAGCSAPSADSADTMLNIEPLYVNDEQLSFSDEDYPPSVIDRGSAVLSFVMVNNYLNNDELSPTEMGSDYYYVYFDWYRAIEDNQLDVKNYGYIYNVDITDLVKEYIDDGYPIIFYMIDNTTYERKYIVITGYTESDEIEIIDPNDSSIKYLSELSAKGYTFTKYLILECRTTQINYLDNSEAMALISLLANTWINYDDSKYPSMYITFAVDQNNDLRMEAVAYETEYNYPEYFYIDRIIKVDDNNYIINASYHIAISTNDGISIYRSEFLTININIAELNNGIINVQFGYDSNWGSADTYEYQNSDK